MSGVAMTRHKTRRSPRVPSSGPSDWRAKVHPLYLRILQQYRTIVDLGQSPSAEDRQEAERLKRNPPKNLLEEVRRLGEERRRSGGAVTPVAATILGSNDAKIALCDPNFMQHWLAWNKGGKTLEGLVQEDREANEKSSRQLQNVRADFQKWRYGKLNAEELKTKHDREHRDLIMMGLEFGIENLTAEELADFANDECPCGRKNHSPENLRKLRSRILAAL